MAGRSLAGVLRYVRGLADANACDHSDGDLLERFIARRGRGLEKETRMRRNCLHLLCLLLPLVLPARGPAADLEQVVTHEHPLFKPAEAHLTVGRDGRAYLAPWGLTGGR